MPLPKRATRSRRGDTEEPTMELDDHGNPQVAGSQLSEAVGAVEEDDDVVEVGGSQARGRASQSQAQSRRSARETQRQASEAASVNDEEMEVAGASQATAQAPPASAAREEQTGLPSATFSAQNDANHVKILLATDNHVGYMEKDPVRGQDSINTFKEILQLAKEHDVDFILLGGDLFHENKPTRSTLHQVIALLREYTLGDKPVSIELLSDPMDGHAEGYSFPAVNYEDANLNVAIPVFSIHGNHDDPQGVGVEGALSALDLLSVSGLINYFGKVELPSSDALAGRANQAAPADGGLSDVGIRVRPVLLQKGQTRIALYGMGNIKDERMHYELRANRVRMYRPREDPESWFNILAVHQNRVAHNPKAMVPETMFDDSVHLVVWGHEHEQLIQPQPVAGKRYHITQPGSSVATSLSPGETAEKQVAIIHVEGRDFMIEPLKLKTARPFVLDDIDLDMEMETAGVASDDKAGLTKLLKRSVYELIDRAHAEWEELHRDVPKKERPKEMLPLVRLRVSYTQHALGSLVRFGQEFVDKVANPKEVLLFQKKRVAGAKKDKNGDLVGETEYIDPDGAEMRSLMPSERLEKVDVGSLVKKHLQAQKLNILNPDGLERAVLNFVDKDDRDAIGHFVTKMLKTTVSGLSTMDPDEEQLNAELERIAEEQQRRGEGEEEEEAEEATPAPKSKSRRGAAAHINSDDSMLEEDDDDDAFDDGESTRSASPVKRGAAARKAPAKKAPAASARGRAKGKKTFLGDESDEDEAMAADDNDDDEVQEVAPPATSSRAAALSAMGKKKAPAPRKAAAPKATAAKATTFRSKAAPAASSSLRQSQLSFSSTPTPAARAGNRRATASAAAQRTRSALIDEDDEDDD